jgi:hypothetical protein
VSVLDCYVQELAEIPGDIFECMKNIKLLSGVYVGDALRLVDRLDPGKKLGQENAEHMARYMLQKVRKHNLEAHRTEEYHRLITPEFGDFPFGYFVKKGLDVDLDSIHKLLENI